MEWALQISLSHSIKHAHSPTTSSPPGALPFVFCQVIYPFHVSNIWTEYHNLKYFYGSVRTSRNANLRSVQVCLFSHLYLSALSISYLLTEHWEYFVGQTEPEILCIVEVKENTIRNSPLTQALNCSCIADLIRAKYWAFTIKLIIN